MAIGSLVVNNKTSDRHRHEERNAKVSSSLTIEIVATSNGSTTSMYLDTNALPESVLEQQVAAKLKGIRWIVGLCRELWQVEDKYAQQYHKVLGACCTSSLGHHPTGTLTHRRLAKIKTVSSSYEIAMELQLAFEKLLLSFGLMKTQVATSLQQDVLLPMENLLAQQTSQSKQLVQELLDASQQYKQAESRLLRLQEKRRLLIEASSDHDDLISSSSSSPEQEDNNNKTTTVKKSITRQKELIEAMKHSRLQCALSRQAIQTAWAQLRLTEQQRIEFMQHKILQHLTNVYDQMISQTRIFLEAMQNQLTTFQSQTSTAFGAFNTASRQEEETDDQVDVDEEERILFAQFDACVLRTTQMDSLFQQFFHLETNFQRKLQQLVKTYNLTNWLQQDVSRRTTFCTSMGAFISQDLPKLLLFHFQLTTNLQDPIGRTLKFSSSKQNRIKQECLQVLSEHKKRVQQALTKLKDKQQKLDKALLMVTADPTTSSTNEKVIGASNSNSENSFSLMTSPRVAAAAAMKFASSSNSIGINMSTFGLRTAVVTSKLTGRDTSSTFDAITASPFSLSLSHTTSIQVLENDVLQAKALVKSLQTSYQLQLQETKGTLEKTALGGLQTLQLMLKDYLKSVNKAVDTLKTCMSHIYTLGEAVRPEADALYVFPDKIWQVFLQLPSANFNQEDTHEEKVEQDEEEEIVVGGSKDDKPEQAEQQEQSLQENQSVQDPQTKQPVADAADTKDEVLGAVRKITGLFLYLIKKAYAEFLSSEWRHHVDWVSVGCLFVTYVCLLAMLMKVQQAQMLFSQLVLAHQHTSTQNTRDLLALLDTASLPSISKTCSM